MSPSIWQLLIVLAIVIILFGRGRIAGVMTDIGKGIRGMREGLKGNNKDEADPQISQKTEENSTDKTS